ncbi:MAG: BA14K family protein [Shinella sp.]|nr:BA14K family protein [Shinella sp.]
MSIASAIAPISASQAMPLAAPAGKIEAKSNVVEARVVCNAYRCWRERPRYHRPRYHARRYYRPRPYRGNAHVRWCLNRYRTYNPATNRYHAGGGVYRVCYSPYR